jgi:hypothetical protein
LKCRAKDFDYNAAGEPRHRTARTLPLKDKIRLGVQLMGRMSWQLPLARAPGRIVGSRRYE